MTGNKLKWIAVLTMFLDHLAIVLISGEPYTLFRSIGRLSFPIFCFLISEGLAYTRDRYRYLARLVAFALISEIPFDLTFHGAVLEFGAGQNVFFTLALGLSGLILYDHFKKYIKIGALIFPLLCMLIAEWMNTDYRSMGVLMITVCYLLRDFRYVQLGGIALTNVAMRFVLKSSTQLYGCAAIVPIALYNGKRGRGSKFSQYFFYVFYPAHLLLLWGLSKMLT